jgi:hypothetical protein
MYKHFDSDGKWAYVYHCSDSSTAIFIFLSFYTTFSL